MTTTQQNETMTVANTISGQIGSRAFFMMGTRYQVGSENSLAFDVKSRRANKIKITLDASDTYTVTFYKITGRGLNVKVVAELEGVYADGMKQVIERNTELYLSL